MVRFDDRPRLARKQPHRGALILTLGILSVFLPIFAPITWSVGGHDLDRMAVGRLDNRDGGMTRAGVLLAQLVLAAWVLGIIVLLIYGSMLSANG